jgi:septal ring factor EnvC (AmiA/AmiB activator)
MTRLASAAVFAALAACAPLENTDARPEPVAVKAKPAARSGNGLVAYLAEIRNLGDASLTREIARQRQLLVRDGGDAARTRLALALSLSQQGDEAEILGLVEPVARKENAPADVRAMASFLHTIASERRRLKESAAAANAKVREERKAAEAQKQRADTLQERAAQLQQKLDALTELEKSLSDRPISNR